MEKNHHKIIKQPFIKTLIDKSCKAKVDACFKVNNKIISTYFIDNKESEYIVLIDRVPKSRKIIQGTDIIFEFKNVMNGILTTFTFKTKFIKKEAFGYFNSLFIEYPSQIEIININTDYKYVVPESDMAKFYLEFNDKILPQNVLKLNLSKIQFYFTSKEKDTKKHLYIGKIFDFCELEISTTKIALSAQISSYEAGTIIMHILKIDDNSKNMLKKYLQNLYFHSTIQDRFGWDSFNNSAFQLKRVLGRKKVLIVENNENYNLALKEYLNIKGFYTSCVTKKKNILQIATHLKPDVILMNIKLQWNKGLNVGNELQKNKLTKNIPIIYLKDVDSPYTIENIIDYGGVELFSYPLKLNELYKKLNAAISMFSQNENNNNFKILLLNKGDQRISFLMSEWANNEKYQILKSDSVREFPRTVILKNINAVFINSKEGMERYILETCNKLHNFEATSTIPVFIISKQIFTKKFIVLKDNIYGINTLNTSTFAIINKILKEE